MTLNPNTTFTVPIGALTLGPTIIMVTPVGASTLGPVLDLTLPTGGEDTVNFTGTISSSVIRTKNIIDNIQFIDEATSTYASRLIDKSVSSNIIFTTDTDRAILLPRLESTDFRLSSRAYVVRVRTQVARKVRYYNMLNITTFPLPIGIIREGSNSNIVLQPGERVLYPESDLDIAQIRTYVERKFLKLLADASVITNRPQPPVITPDETYHIANISRENLRFTITRNGSVKEIILRPGKDTTLPKSELNFGQVANYRARKLITVRVIEL